MSRRGQGRGWWYVNLALATALVSSAVAVVETSHRCRQHYAQLQELETRQWNMQEQWGRLLLEQSTWAAHYRVEELARRELHMRLPAAEELKVVRP